MKKIAFKLSLTALVLASSFGLAQAGTTNSGVGQPVSGAVVSQKNGEWVVSGTISRGVASHRVPGAHVHVQLVDSKGKILKSASRSLPPTAPQRDAALNYRARYSVGFPIRETAGFAAVRVQYLDNTHQECLPPTGGKHCQSC